MSPTSTATPAAHIESNLKWIFQYTIDAYKTFEKLAENLPNPTSAAMFQNFAEEERHHRDLLEIKYLSGSEKINVTIVNDLRYQDMVEGNLSNQEIVETLISQERAMGKKLMDAIKAAPPRDRNLLIYLAAGKRAHAALLERELALVQVYPDWFQREDAESLIVHGHVA